MTELTKEKYDSLVNNVRSKTVAKKVTENDGYWVPNNWNHVHENRFSRGKFVLALSSMVPIKALSKSINHPACHKKNLLIRARMNKLHPMFFIEGVNH
jgi:hypothetical protein